MRKGIPALLLTLSLLLCGCRLLPERIPPAGLTVHFIDVGQADCALLESGGEYMLIDGGNREDGRLVVSYLEQQGVEELAAVVCTHAHEDHVGGLPSGSGGVSHPRRVRPHKDLCFQGVRRFRLLRRPAAAGDHHSLPRRQLDAGRNLRHSPRARCSPTPTRTIPPSS